MNAVIDKNRMTVIGYDPIGITYGENCDNVGVPFDNSLYGKPLKVTKTEDFYSISLDEEAYNQQVFEANKAYRDKCLKKTDFTQLPDTGLTNVPEWSAFRATLRSLDLTPPVSWPTEPFSPWGPFLPTPPS